MPIDADRRFWRLTTLNILTNLTVPLSSLVDTALLGHLPDIRFLAGVSLASIIFEYIYWTFGFLRMGTTGLTAQAHGGRRTAEVYEILYRGVTIALGLGLFILLIGVPLRELGFALLAGSGATEAAGRQYFDARIWGAPAVLANFTFVGWYLGRAESRFALLMTVVAHTVNVALDYLFIVRLGMAAAGAGLATAISQYAMLATAVLIFVFPGSSRADREDGALVPFFGRSALLSRAELTRLMNVNFNILVRTVLLISAFAAFLNISAVFGTVVLAANAILYRLQMLAAYFVDGAAFATESLAGIFKGAGDTPRLAQLRRKSLRTGLLLTTPFVFAVLLAPRQILSLLTSHQPTLEAAVDYAPWLAIALFPGSLAFIFDGYYLGLTRVRELRNAMIASFAGAFLPVAAVAFLKPSNHILWLAMALFMITRAACLAWLDRNPEDFGRASSP